MKLTLYGWIIILIMLALIGSPPEIGSLPHEGIHGFWGGFYHGMISAYSFIISLFNDKVTIYDIHNNGAWYNFGYVLASGILFGGSSSSSSTKRS